MVRTCQRVVRYFGAPRVVAQVISDARRNGGEYTDGRPLRNLGRERTCASTCGITFTYQ